MKTPLKLAALLLTATLTAISCQKKEEKTTNPDEVVEASIQQSEADAAYDEARSNDTTGIDIARTGAEKIIADNQERIAEFRLKANAAAGDEKKKLNDEIDKLEVRNNQIRDELAKFQEKTDSNLKDFVSKLNKDAAKMQEDVEKYRKDHY